MCVCTTFIHVVLLLTYAHDVHEAVHAIADLEEQVLALPLGGRAERRPHQPRDTGNEEERAQDNGGDLHLLNHCQRNRLPLKHTALKKTL